MSFPIFNRCELFRCVREITLYDERPFEHEFFLRIAPSFPLLEKLTLKNDQSHRSYVEQFLISSKMYLPNDVLLWVDYESLQNATHNFTRDETRKNSYKVTSLILFHKPESCQYIKDYFPNAELD